MIIINRQGYTQLIDKTYRASHAQTETGITQTGTDRNKQNTYKCSSAISIKVYFKRYDHDCKIVNIFL